MSNPPSSIRPDPGLHRSHLRIFFSYYLLHNDRVKEIANQLQPTWKRVLASSYDADAISQVALDALPQSDRMALSYSLAIRDAVAKDLRCNESGQPAGWVCNQLHGIVANHQQVLFPQVPDIAEHHRGDLRIAVPVSGAAVVAGLVNGKAVNEGNIVAREDLDTYDPALPRLPPSYDAFTDWKSLRKTAREDLDRVIDELQRLTEKATADWKRRSDSGYTTLIYNTLPSVVRWLVDREKQFGSDRMSSHRALELLGLDKPGS